MAFAERTGAPSSTNKYYLKRGKVAGALNECIEIVKKIHSCLANCVGYCWGRAYEAMGKKPKLSKGNAENWYNYKDGYPRGQEPKAGAIACWRQGKAGVESDGAGHVEFVERVKASGDIATTASNYGGKRWYCSTRKKSNNYSLGSNYTFQGFIYLPVDVTPTPEPVDPTPTPKPKPKFSVGTKVKITGNGNTNILGTGTKNGGIGYKRLVLKYYDEEKYPYAKYRYKIGNAKGVATGFYKESELKKV